MPEKFIVEREKVRAGKVYKDHYKMSQVGGGYMISIPKRLVERRTEELGVTIDKFLEDYRVVAMYDRFDEIDIAYKFVKRGED